MTTRSEPALCRSFQVGGTRLPQCRDRLGLRSAPPFPPPPHPRCRRAAGVQPQVERNTPNPASSASRMHHPDRNVHTCTDTRALFGVTGRCTGEFSVLIHSAAVIRHTQQNTQTSLTSSYTQLYTYQHRHMSL